MQEEESLFNLWHLLKEFTHMSLESAQADRVGGWEANGEQGPNTCRSNKQTTQEPLLSSVATEILLSDQELLQLFKDMDSRGFGLRFICPRSTMEVGRCVCGEHPRGLDTHRFAGCRGSSKWSGVWVYLIEWT